MTDEQIVEQVMDVDTFRYIDRLVQNAEALKQLYKIDDFGILRCLVCGGWLLPTETMISGVQILNVLVKHCKECIWPTVYTSDAKDSPPAGTAQGQDSIKK